MHQDPVSVVGVYFQQLGDGLLDVAAGAEVAVLLRRVLVLYQRVVIVDTLLSDIRIF